MRRRRWLLVLAALVLVAAVLFVVLLLTPTPTVVEQPAPPPVAKPPARPLQADAEGTYVPGYSFTVNRYRFTGFSLRPDPYVTFVTAGGAEQALACTEAVIKPEVVHLKCDDPQVGTVTIDGRFLTRVATERLDIAVLSAVVTVRTGSGQVVYSARDSFQWHPAD